MVSLNQLPRAQVLLSTHWVPLFIMENFSSHLAQTPFPFCPGTQFLQNEGQGKHVLATFELVELEDNTK
jgi:hypothetical protein